MPAPKGNNNAEKWTEQQASEFVESVLDYVQSNSSCVFIGEPVTELGYYRELWNYISGKFDFHTIKRVESILESRLVKSGISGTNNATMTIFTLKNNYNWRDKTETEHSGTLSHEATVTIVNKPNAS